MTTGKNLPVVVTPDTDTLIETRTDADERSAVAPEILPPLPPNYADCGDEKTSQPKPHIWTAFSDRVCFIIENLNINFWAKFEIGAGSAAFLFLAALLVFLSVLTLQVDFF